MSVFNGTQGCMAECTLEEIITETALRSFVHSCVRECIVLGLYSIAN
jgi:hypothetical protein